MTKPGTFEGARLGELPPYLDGVQGRGIVRVLGRAQDVEQAKLTDAVLIRYPLRTPIDALDHLGASSNIERFTGEPNGTPVPPTNYHGRLVGRWDTWIKAGSAQGIIDSLNYYGIADVTVAQDWQTGIVPGAWYSRFDVILGPTLPYTPMILGVWVLGESGTLGSSATVLEVKAIKRQILKWKSAHSYPVRIILDFGAVAASSVDAVVYAASGFGPDAGDMAVWHLGKLFGEDTSMPFTLGGYIL
jgi:hypothetical protein